MSINTCYTYVHFQTSLQKKICRSCFATFSFHNAWTYFHVSIHREIPAFLSAISAHRLFYLNLHCQAIRVFPMFIASSARCHRACTFVRLCQCFCRTDSQKRECRILARNLEAFSVLSQASQLSRLISAQLPFKSNLANSHSRE